MRDHSDIDAPAAAFQACVEQIRQAVTDGQTLQVLGGATKCALRPAVRQAGASLPMRALSGITSYEPSELVLTALAGTPLAEVEAALAERRQCLPFEPPRLAPGGTLGGMVAAGLSGPARATVGSVRDHILGIALLDGRARLLRFGGQVMKNVAGYDVSRLLAGSWGRLGAVAQVSLKVLPVAPAEASLCFSLDEQDALEALARWNAQPLPLNASCWLLDSGEPRLYLRLRGAAAAVEAACNHLGGARLNPDHAARDWAACRDLGLPWFTQRDPGECLWRVSVPPTAPPLGLPHPTLIEWFGALRWVRAPVDAAPAIVAAASRAGGSASMFIASDDHSAIAQDGFGSETSTREPHRLLEQRLAAVFDPHGIFAAPPPSART